MKSSSTYTKVTAGLRIRFAFLWFALAVSLLALGAGRVEAQKSWGLKANNNQFWQQGHKGLGGVADGILQEDDSQNVNHFRKMGDRFGQAVATGDFNGDGYADIAVGAPDEDSPLAERFVQGKGAVTIIYGSSIGLDSFNTQILKQGLDHMPGTADIRDRFGSALAAGDFNGDGFADLAIGIPGENAPSSVLENVSDSVGEGAFTVIYGGPSGLNSAYGRVGQTRLWQQGTCDAPTIEGGKCLLGQNGASDRFGASLTSGDFDGDGVDDLAIGVPGNLNFTGAVAIIYGSHTNDLAAVNGTYKNQFFTQGYCDSTSIGGECIPGNSEEGDHFGESLIAADFTGDGVDDLAIGVPEENHGDEVRSGAVNVIYGKAGQGLLAMNSISGNSLFTQGRCRAVNNPGTCVKGNPEREDLFGSALAAGDFNEDGAYDLAIGAPGEDNQSGVVSVIYGGSDGLQADNAGGNQIFSQDSDGVQDHAESDNRFGAALTTGDFNGDGAADLAIGVPDEDDQGLGDPEGAGAVNVIYGRHVTEGLSAGNEPGDQFWSQDTNLILDEGGAYFDEDEGTADQFGSALATGDFNGDGTSDLAIGVPGESDNSFFELGDAGAVNVLYGNHIDSTPPLVGYSLIGDIGETTILQGVWYTSSVKVFWFIQDNESAIVGTTPCPLVLVLDTGPDGREVSCTARSEGGITNLKATVHVDTHGPEVVVPITPAPNALGWNNTNVHVGVDCTEFPGGSGMRRCSDARTFTASGRYNFVAEGVDIAGNVTSRPVSINIDKIDPTITSVSYSTPLILQNTTVTATANASDTLSGLSTKSCERPNTTTTGLKSLTCTAIDKAGNGTIRSFSYTVLPPLLSGVNTASSSNGVTTASWGSGGLGVGSLNSVSVVARGEGTATVAGFISNPGAPAGFTTSNAFSFVNFEDGHTFDEATITNCRLGGGSLAYWRKGDSWQLVADQTYDRARSCLTIRLTDTTSPSISDLTGGAFFGIKNTEDQILDVMALVDSFNFTKSTDKKLNHDLDKALAAARQGDPNGVCKELERFIKQVDQEASKKVTSEEATELLTAANRIKTLSACP